MKYALFHQPEPANHEYSFATELIFKAQMKKIAFVLSILFLAGCASTGHLNTPSGRPEITVRSSIANARKETTHWLLSGGYTVGNTPDATSDVIFISGNQYYDNGATSVTLRFNFFPVDSMTTTIYATKIIWRRFGGNQPQTSQSDFEELQNDLNAIAQNLSATH